MDYLERDNRSAFDEGNNSLPLIFASLLSTYTMLFIESNTFVELNYVTTSTKNLIHMWAKFFFIGQASESFFQLRMIVRLELRTYVALIHDVYCDNVI